MMKRVLPLFLLISALQGQPTPRITLDTPATSTQLQQWLHSSDPRLVAWSAALAARDHNDQILAELPNLLERWPTAPLHDSSSPYWNQKTAILEILDTLIQTGTPVPSSTIRAIAVTFPPQAAILLARLPPDQSRPILNDWFRSFNGDWPNRTLARIAAMMLAQEPTPEFVATTLNDAEEYLIVSIVQPGNIAGSGSGFGNACGDSLGRSPDPAWPQVYNYDLVENENGGNHQLLVSIDDDRIQTRRFPANTPWGSCFYVRPLDAATRHRLIAHWLGVTPRDVPWQPQQSVSIVWTNLADYNQQLGAAITAQRALLRATVNTLRRQRGLLGPTPEPDNDPILPQLSITIRCYIKPCPITP
jgi:hypothetical protein